MPREFSRSRRVEEQILRLLAELVRREVKDPRVGLVTLTAVEVSKDLSHAKVYFLPFDSSRDIREVGEALGAASGFLRSLLRKQLAMRHVPLLHFVPDESIERAAKLSALINTAVARDAATHVDDEASAPGEDASAAGEDAAAAGEDASAAGEDASAAGEDAAAAGEHGSGAPSKRTSPDDDARPADGARGDSPQRP